MTEDQHHSSHARHNVRLDRLEGVVEGLAQNQARMEATIGAMAENVSTMSSHLDVFATQTVQSAKTNWGVLMSGGSLLLAIILALGVGFVGKPLGNVQTLVKEEHDSFLEHVKDGHPKTVVALIKSMSANHEKALDVLDHDMREIQARMRAHEVEVAAIDATQESRLLGLERLIFPDAKYRAGKPQ